MAVRILRCKCREAGADPLQNLVVIECEFLGQPVEAMPADCGRIIRRNGARSGIGARQKGDADGPAARIAVWIAERRQLFQVDAFESRLLVQFALCGGRKRFSRIDEPARQRPGPGERLVLAPDQQHARRWLSCQDDDVHRHRGSLIVVNVFAFGIAHGR